jgi:iron complex transport system ATP-binding protein
VAASGLTNLEAAARELVAQVLGGLNPLHDRLVEATGVARGLLDGNAAAAVVGSAASLKRFGQHRYGALRELEPLMSVVLQLNGVRDWLELAPPTPGRTGLTRRSCCLYYRTPKGGVCGDCPVRDTTQIHPRTRVR